MIAWTKLQNYSNYCISESVRTSCCTDCAIAQVNIARFVRNQLALNPFRNNCCPIPSHIKERPPKKNGIMGEKIPSNQQNHHKSTTKKEQVEESYHLPDSRTAFDSKRPRRPGLVSASSVFPLVRLPIMIWTSPFIQTAPDSPKACQTPFNWINLS